MCLAAPDALRAQEVLSVTISYYPLLCVWLLLTRCVLRWSAVATVSLTVIVTISYYQLLPCRTCAAFASLFILSVTISYYQLLSVATMPHVRRVCVFVYTISYYQLLSVAVCCYHAARAPRLRLCLCLYTVCWESYAAPLSGCVPSPLVVTDSN